MIQEIEYENFLANYDGSEPVQHFKVKDLFSKKGRQEIIDEVKDKHPKLKKALDKHPGLEKLAKTALAVEAAMIGQAAVLAAAAGAYYVGSTAATTGGLAMFKPAMQATLKAKGEQTNGLSLKEIAAKFLKANGKKSQDANGDFSFIADYFGAKMDKAKRAGASPEDQLINNLIDGTINAVKSKGTDFINDLITGNDAAPDTPLAQPEPSKKDEETPGMDKKNLYLIFGAIVLIVILARK